MNKTACSCPSVFFSRLLMFSCARRHRHVFAARRQLRCSNVTGCSSSIPGREDDRDTAREGYGAAHTSSSLSEKLGSVRATAFLMASPASPSTSTLVDSFFAPAHSNTPHFAAALDMNICRDGANGKARQKAGTQTHGDARTERVNAHALPLLVTQVAQQSVVARDGAKGGDFEQVFGRGLHLAHQLRARAARLMQVHNPQRRVRRHHLLVERVGAEILCPPPPSQPPPHVSLPRVHGALRNRPSVREKTRAPRGELWRRRLKSDKLCGDSDV